MPERATGGSLSAVLVEDHPMMRSAMELTLGHAGITVSGSVSTGQEAYDLVAERRPDVVVTDLGLPGETGVELTRRLRRRDSRLAVVIYTGLDDPVALKDALECGASGIIYKTSDPGVLVTAVRTAAAGGAYVSEEVHAVIARRGRGQGPRATTDREREVLQLLGIGRSNEEIAAELMLSVETVRTHVRNAMRKLGAHTRAHAIVLALRNEEISL